MRIQAIKTRLLRPPQDDLFEILTKSIKRLPERSVVVIASKVVSIHQGRCVLKSTVKDKDKLIQKEADQYLPRNKVPGGHAVLTIKHKILIPSAGIDESNSGDYYILWPHQLKKVALELLCFFKKKYKVKKLGVIITDSHTTPLRRGVQGIALSFAGIKPINDYRGTKDLFNKIMEVSTLNIVDSLASAAVVVMGEGKEQTPVALVTEIPFVEFIQGQYNQTAKDKRFHIPLKEDLYGPLLKAIKWKNK